MICPHGSSVGGLLDPPCHLCRIEELEAQVAAMTQDFTDYKRMTDLAYKSSEQETLDKLAASQAREASWKQQAEDAALTISGLLKDLADKHSVFCPHCNPCRHAEELAAMTKERDGAVAILEQTLVGISFGELLKAYAAYRAGEKYETVVDRLEEQLAAMTAERDEAVAAVQKLSEGQPFQTVVVADVVRRGLEQLAASQAREQQLREALHRVIGCHVEQGESMQHHALNALSLPQNDTALQEALAKEREKVLQQILESNWRGEGAGIVAVLKELEQ